MSDLLSVLGTDFSGKTSVKDCLRRSKATLAPEVKRVLQDEDLSLDTSSMVVCKASLTKLLVDLKKAGGSTQKAEPSIHYFSTISKACNLFQLICEYHQDKDKENKSDCESNERRPKNFSMEDTLKILDNLGLALASLESASFDENPSENDDDFFISDATTSFDPRQVAAFGFASILRLNSYAMEKVCQPSVIVSIWKSLKRVIDSMRSFPVDLLIDAFTALNEMLAEGVEHLVSHSLVDDTDLSAQTSENRDTIAYRFKIFAFALSQAISLCSKSCATEALSQISILNHLLTPLAVVLGLCLLRKAQNSPGDSGHSFRDALEKVTKKTLRLISTLWQIAGNAEGRLLATAISASLVSLSWDSADDFGSQYSKPLYAGKLHMQLDFLSKILTSQQKKATGDEFEICLRICEDIVFVTLPRLVDGINNLQGDFMYDSVDAALTRVTEVLILTGTSVGTSSFDDCTATRQFHFLMLFWLSRVSSNAVHPISREVLVASICGYTEYFCEHEGLLVLVLDLIFDERTEDNFRRFLTVLVLRFSESNVTMRKIIQHLISERVEKLILSLEKQSRKRTRNQGKRLSLQSIATIHAVLPIVKQIEHNSSNRSTNNVVLSIQMLMANQVKEADLLEKMKGFLDFIPAKRSKYARRFSTIGHGFAQLLQKMCTESAAGMGLSQDLIHTAARFFDRCFSDFSDHESLTLVSRAIGTLRVVANALPSNISRNDFERISQAFHKVLRIELWPLRSTAVTAFVAFTVKAREAHKNILLECVPSPLTRTIQFRVKQKPSISSDLVRTLQFRHKRDLATLSKGRNPKHGMFPSSSAMYIPKGSYIVSMPSREGRNAMVVFLPGPHAMDDVEFMLSNCDEEDRPAVHHVRHVLATNNGCKLFLSE